MVGSTRSLTSKRRPRLPAALPYKLRLYFNKDNLPCKLEELRYGVGVSHHLTEMEAHFKGQAHGGEYNIELVAGIEPIDV